LLQPLLALTLHSTPDYQTTQRSSCNGADAGAGQRCEDMGSQAHAAGGQELLMHLDAVNALLGQVGGTLCSSGSACKTRSLVFWGLATSATIMMHACALVLQPQAAIWQHSSLTRWHVCVASVRQVVASACQLLVAVNQPLDPVSCAHVLDFLWDQLTRTSSAAAVACAGQHASSASLTGGHTVGASNNGSAALTAAAPHYAAAIWCLAQQPQHQQQLLLDGRWAQMLDLLAKPCLHRVKRAATASSRACTSSGGNATVSASGSSVLLPRLQLHRVAGVQGFSSVRSAISEAGSSSGAACAAGGSCFSSGAGSSAGSSKRAAEAVRVLQLCLQSCWLLLQQEACMRQMAAELPADLRAVYAKGRSSWWALELDKPR
jgi:hypothetical protein